MTTHNPKFRGTPGPWRVDGHEHKNGVVEYTLVGIFEPHKLTPYWSMRETVNAAKKIIGYIYGVDERNRTTNESPSNDAEFLEWLYVRLVGTHGENPNTDYMQNLTSIIEKLR